MRSLEPTKDAVLPYIANILVLLLRHCGQIKGGSSVELRQSKLLFLCGATLSCKRDREQSRR